MLRWSYAYERLISASAVARVSFTDNAFCTVKKTSPLASLCLSNLDSLNRHDFLFKGIFKI